VKEKRRERGCRIDFPVVMFIGGNNTRSWVIYIIITFIL
jgi:hypothetical protein